MMTEYRTVPGRQPRVLVVVSEPLFREALASGIEATGCIVTVAEHPATALDLLRDCVMAPDAIVLGSLLVGMSGAEFERELARTGGDLSDIPIIPVASNLDPENWYWRRNRYTVMN